MSESKKTLPICQDAYDFLRKFSYVKIDKRNPMLIEFQKLRRLMVLRRKAHKAFDMINCNRWQTIITQSGFGEYKNMLLRECYMTQA
jgi:hypothetical protein